MYLKLKTASIHVDFTPPNLRRGRQTKEEYEINAQMKPL